MVISNTTLMLKLVLFLLAWAGCLQAAEAQADSARRGMFYSINSIGDIRGASGSAFGFQTINGYQKNNFFVGLGLGLDRYRYDGMPVFVDGRLYTGRVPRGFFLYEDAGLHYVIKKNTNTWSKPSYPPGYYNDAGIGYKLVFSGRSALVLSGGWSYKRVTQEQTQLVCPFAPPCRELVEKYKYDFNRVIVKLGLGF